MIEAKRYVWNAWIRYKRVGECEMTPWSPDTDMTQVSVHETLRVAGHPKAGDMIARDIDNRDDVWLVTAEYFERNFEPCS